MRVVHFYRAPNGHCPVEDFLDALSAKQAQKVVWVLRLVEELESVPAQYFKRLAGTEHLWEVRVRYGGETFRVLGFVESAALILTNGFSKKSDRIPRREIDLATARRREYLKRKEPHE